MHEKTVFLLVLTILASVGAASFGEGMGLSGKDVLTLGMVVFMIGIAGVLWSLRSDRSSAKNVEDKKVRRYGASGSRADTSSADHYLTTGQLNLSGVHVDHMGIIRHGHSGHDRTDDADISSNSKTTTSGGWGGGNDASDSSDGGGDGGGGE